MKKALKVIILVLACLALSLGAIACGAPHEHTFKDAWSTSAEKHWKDASCGHDVKSEEADHTFGEGVLSADKTKLLYTCSVCEYVKEETVNHQYGEGVLSADKTQITYTCSECGDVRTEAHTHTYGGWVTESLPTMITDGVKYRVCTYTGCETREEGTLAKINVSSISITSNPTKLSYKVGEAFDKTGLVVTATGEDNSTLDVTSLVSIEEKELVFGANEITITFVAHNGTFTEKLFVTVTRDTVAGARKDATVGEKLAVAGYYVGIADEGPSADKEMLVKDLETDDIIAVRNVKYGTFANGYGYKYGDLVELSVTVKEEVTSGYATKRYLDFNSDNPVKIEDTILTRNNKVEYTFDDAVEMPNYKNWQSVLGKTSAVYTYVHITGVLYTSKYNGASDKVMAAVLTANTEAMSWNNVKVETKSSGRLAPKNLPKYRSLFPQHQQG